MNVVLVGASITGNRGAESMLRAAVEGLREGLPEVDITLLSLYPEGDRAENDLPGLRIIPFSPAQASKDPMLAACPTINVETLGRTYCIVS